MMPYTIAVDFDGTLVEDKYPLIGGIKSDVWEKLEQVKIKQNAKIILWTCRNGQALKDAVEFCNNHGLHFDAINENLDEIKVLYGGDTRKIFADEYWDDKAIPIGSVQYGELEVR